MATSIELTETREGAIRPTIKATLASALPYEVPREVTTDPGTTFSDIPTALRWLAANWATATMRISVSE